MEVNAKLVRDLREKTGAGVMDCKKALAESKGDLEKAVVGCARKASPPPPSAPAARHRKAPSARISTPAASSGCWSRSIARPTSSAKTPEFQALVKEVAMQIAAANPRCVRREELPAAVIEQERQIYAQQTAGKPENVIAKIVEGKLEKFFKDACLLEQSLGARPQSHDQRPDRRVHRQARRKDRCAALRALSVGRVA